MKFFKNFEIEILTILSTLILAVIFDFIVDKNTGLFIWAIFFGSYLLFLIPSFLIIIIKYFVSKLKNRKK